MAGGASVIIGVIVRVLPLGGRLSSSANSCSFGVGVEPVSNGGSLATSAAKAGLKTKIAEQTTATASLSVRSSNTYRWRLINQTDNPG